MKWAIFGDVHSNLAALEAVLLDIAGEKPDGLLCTGDIVGYGAQPSECIARIQELNCPAVAGNHDYAAVGKIDTSLFNLEAHESARWTAEHLTALEKEYLSGLPLTTETEIGMLVHSSPASPDNFPYIFDIYEVKMAMAAMKSRLCFIGHSHSPVVIYTEDDDFEASYEAFVDISGTEKAIINVGSVGQPRDNDIRAAYAIYDTDSDIVEIRRVDYDWSESAKLIRKVGLPEHNASRLGLGI